MELPPRPRPGSLNTSAARWLRLLPLAFVMGCDSEPDYGSFRMRASDDNQAEINGPAATHSSFESGYTLALDLRWTASRFFDPNGLSFDFGQKPEPGVWRLTMFGKSQPRGGRIAWLAFDMRCANPDRSSDTTVSSRWVFDSGLVHVTSPVARKGITGSFSIFLHCGSADSLHATNRVLLSGTFETHGHGS